jgi:response regulator RpfG family c-di-GMP phosphodiesterase
MCGPRLFYPLFGAKSMFATHHQESSSSPDGRSNMSAQSVRILCCFSDQRTARGYEKALIEGGFSLLRARHGMHAYWLAITAKPDVVVVDARETDIATDYLLGRLQQNSKLAKTPILVITHQLNASAPNVEAPLMLLAGDIVPSALAARVGDIVLGLRHIQQKNVDTFFSDANSDAQVSSPPSPHAIRRTDSPQTQVVSRSRQEAQRWQFKSAGR